MVPLFLISKLQIMNSHNVYKKLLRVYGPQGWWPLLQRSSLPGYDQEGYHPGIYKNDLQPHEQFEIITGAILTQNTSWTNVRSSMGALLEVCRKKGQILSPEFFLAMDHSELAAIIRSSGYFNQKAKKLKAVSSFYLDNRGDLTIPSRKDLLSIWGIGPETADSILLYAYHRPVCVVDAYSVRIFRRLESRGLTSGRQPATPKEWTYDRLQQKFHSELPPEPRVYNEFHALLVEHGKHYCTSKKQKCNICPLQFDSGVD